MSLESKVESVLAVLEQAAHRYAPAVFANSLGAEDMVLTDLIAGRFPGIEIFTLDTGRLHEETYALMRRIADRYGVRLRIYYPDTQAVEAYVNSFGPNAFYESVEMRKRCCHVRKVEPLRRALAGKKAWITGLRREQAPTRSDLGVSGFDRENGLHKFNPLFDWTTSEVWTYLRTRNIPYNALHDRGFPSIGCAPCTRAVTPDEDIRAGRWWWEDPASKECGLHRGNANKSGARSAAQRPASGQDAVLAVE